MAFSYLISFGNLTYVRLRIRFAHFAYAQLISFALAMFAKSHFNAIHLRKLFNIYLVNRLEIHTKRLTKYISHFEHEFNLHETIVILYFQAME